MGNDQLGIFIADVTGKGVPAALFMARTSTLVRGAGLGCYRPSEAMTRANNLMLQDQSTDLMLTAFYGVLEAGIGRLAYTRAGHTRRLCLESAAGQLRALPGHGILLGAFSGLEFDEHELQMAPGDLVLFFTDGVTDALDADRQPFGTERLQTAVVATAGATAQQVLDSIVEAVHSFTDGSAQFDDLTLLVIRRCPVTPDD